MQFVDFIRVAIFFGVAYYFYRLEEKSLAWSRKTPVNERRQHNIIIVLSNTIIARITFGAWPIFLAYYCSKANIGILYLLPIPAIIHFIFTFLILDLLVYGQHVAFHKISVIWPVHAPHHSDPDLDFTTGLRFHLFEILISFLLKSLTVVVLGLQPAGVLVFEILLNAGSVFNHSNIKLSPKVHDVISGWIVTPQMHRVHHSKIKAEADKNFGFTITLWDKLFGTYMYKSMSQLADQSIGLPQQRKKTMDFTLQEFLLMPFKFWSKYE